jgi:hypothetical protein
MFRITTTKHFKKGHLDHALVEEQAFQQPFLRRNAACDQFLARKNNAQKRFRGENEGRRREA